MAKKGVSPILGVLAVLLAVGGIGWAGVAIFSVGREMVAEFFGRLHDHETAARWEELRKAVVIAGTPLVQSPQTQARDYKDEVARFLALHNSAKLEIENPELVKVWGQIEADTSKGLLILEKIAEIDSKKPSGLEILGKALRDALTDAKQDDNKADREFWGTLSERAFMELDESGREKTFREAEASLNASIGGLQQIADGLSRKELQNAVSVQYTPSWEGRFWGDALDLQNTSDGPLDNAIVVVAVRMKDGGSKVHVHYVDQWQSGTRLSAWYPYQTTYYASAQTGANPDNVDVAVYRPSGTAKASYAMTPEKWDELVKSYCSRLTFSGNYLAPFPGPLESDHHSGFQFTFHGLPTLPVESFEVRFTSATGSVQSAVGSGAVLASGQFLSTRGAQLDPTDANGNALPPETNPPPPSHIDYILKFSGTNYVQAIHAY